MAQKFDWRQYRLEQLAARLGGKAGKDLLNAPVAVQNQIMLVHRQHRDRRGRCGLEVSAPIGTGKHS